MPETTTEEFKAALARIKELTEHTPECLLNTMSWPDADGKYAPDDAHDHAASAFRYCLILAGNDEAFDADPPRGEFDENEAPFAKELYDLLLVVMGYEFGGTEAMTRFAIDDSLCPVHFIDWAICFDDEDPDCAQVRAIYPNCHDT